MSRSKHSLSSYHLTTCEQGQIIPIGCLPVLPGDTIGHSTNLLIRVTPMAAPVMHQVDARIHHFYVPNRILWDGWEDFITGGEDGMNTDTIPQVDTIGDVAGGTVWDFLGVPPQDTHSVSALPLACYNRIFNEWYRDQDLVSKRADTDDSIANCAWEKDYLTTSRPWAQKGPQVSIPIGDKAIVTSGTGISNFADVFDEVNQTYNRQDASATNVTVGAATGSEANALFADLSNAVGASPIDLRTAWGLQRFMENAARFGSRYPEKMQQLGSHYKGVMDRPVYLGGGSSPINFSEVLQTAPEATGRDFGVGDMYGHGISAMRSNKYAYSCGEHGYIMSMLSVRPKAVYQDGIPREFLKLDREDFHDPYLEFVGQQEVWDNEVFAQSGSTNNDVFGYSDKYQEYRGQNSFVSNEYRNTLDYWHMARQFAQKQLIDDAFVECVPTKRIYNEQTANPLWIMAHHRIAAHRNVAKSATPRLL